MALSEPADIRERILEAATVLFVAQGYRGISMREIAEAVGVSKAGVYYHFRDKEALFLAILSHNLERMEAIMRQARQAGPSARQQITYMVRAIFELAPDQRAIIRLASQEMTHLSQAVRAEFARLYRDKFTGQVEAMLRAGMDAGELRAMDAGLATWVLLGMMYPFFYPSQSREEDSSGEAIELILDIFFEGAGQVQRT
jgi:AcrR family transcriptional regulator